MAAVSHPRSQAMSAGALVAVIVTVVLWASAFIGIRYAGHYLSPGPLTLLRLGIGTAALGLFVAVKRGPLPRGRDWWLIIAIGVLWFAIYNLALNAGEQLIDAGTASMVINVAPILIALLAAWLLREGFSLVLGVGLAIAFGGSIIVGLAPTHESVVTAVDQPVIGVLLCLLAAVVYAIAVIIQKGLLSRVSGLQITFWACTVGFVCTLPWIGQLTTELAAAPVGVPWAVAYLGVFPTAIAFTTWAYALRFLPAGKLSAANYTVPATAIAMSWLILGEVPHWMAIVGGSLCIFAVILIRPVTSASSGYRHSAHRA